MNKNMVKRSWLNITRKKNKSIILFIIMFVIANLVLASLSISNAVTESTNYARQTLGSEIYLNPDMEAMKSGMQGMMDEGGMPEEGMDRNAMSSMRPSSSMSMVLEIGESEYVKDFKYSTTVSGLENNFTLVETEESSMFGNRGGMEHGLRITGINSYAFIPEVESNIFSIDEGTYFDEETEDAVIISYELALQNEIEVDETIEIKNEETEEVHTYSVIGIFTSSESGYENSIYMNTSSSEKLMTEETYNEGDYDVTNVVYYLNDPENSEKFILESNTKYNFEELSLVLDIDNSAYEQMAGPIEQVGSFSSTIMIVVIIAAVLIIALIINNSIKDRKYEMGVLMSLGATKKNIVGQIFLELFIVSTVGFILSLGTSTIIANVMSDSLLSSQLEISEEQSSNNFGRPTSMGNMGSMGGQNSSNSDAEAITEIDVNASLNDYLLLFTIGYVIIFIAMTLPTINIMKYEPKTILTGRE